MRRVKWHNVQLKSNKLPLLWVAEAIEFSRNKVRRDRRLVGD